MSGPAFTPGPWELHGREAFGDDEIAIEAAEPQANKGRVISLCYGSDRSANAHLIAAAPEMYEALERIAATHEVVGSETDDGEVGTKTELSEWEMVNVARAALAKARAAQ